MLIGREKEIQELRQAYDSGESWSMLSINQHPLDVNDRTVYAFSIWR